MWAGEERRGPSRKFRHAAGLPLFVASVLCSLAFAAQAEVPQAERKHVKQTSARKQGLIIRVEGGGWGSARREEIETILHAVADELVGQVGETIRVPVVVRHTDGNPMALYDRGPGGEYVVHLHARDESWPLYAYEFAHELCHILSNYAEPGGTDHRRANQWFEEALCETASLYVLRSLATRWAEEPPSPRWGQQAAKLRAFADRLLAEDHRQLPSDAGLAAWVAAHEERLRQDPYRRQSNEVVANLLLPLFERRPASWEAVRYLNRSPEDARARLQEFLANWYANAPDAQRRFIGEVLALFGMRQLVASVAPALPGAGMPAVDSADAAPAGVRNLSPAPPPGPLPRATSRESSPLPDVVPPRSG